MTKSKAFKIFLLLFVAVFAIGVFAAFAACGGDDNKTSGNGDVVLETKFFAGYGCTIAWTFKDDGTVDAVVDGYPTLDGTYEWAYTKADETEMTVYSFGEGDPDWTIELLSYNDEVIALYITSDSPAGLTGPYVAYPSGITAALQTQDEVMNYTGNIIVLYDSGTLNYYWSTNTFPSDYTISGSTLTFTVNGSETTGELTFDEGGFIDSLTIGSMLGATDIYFTPYGLEDGSDNNNEEEAETAAVIAELTSTSQITFTAFGGGAYTCILTLYDDDTMDLTLTNVSTFPCTYTISNGTLTFSSDNGTYTNVTGTVTTTAVNDIITQISFTNFCNEGAATFTVGGADIVGTLSATTTMTVYGMSATPELVFYSGETMTFYFGSSMSFDGTYSITDNTITFSAGMFSSISGTVTLDSNQNITEISNADFGSTYGALSFNTTGTAAA